MSSSYWRSLEEERVGMPPSLLLVMTLTFQCTQRSLDVGADVVLKLEDHAGSTSNPKAGNANDHTIVFVVGPTPIELGSDEVCKADVGVRSTNTDIQLPASAMTSNVPGSTFLDATRATGSWAMGGASGTASLANGQNYFQFDLGTETTVAGIRLRGADATGGNLALQKNARHIATYSGNTAASKAVDGVRTSSHPNCAITSSTFARKSGATEQAWWRVDFGDSVDVGKIKIWRRTDCCSERLDDVEIYTTDVDVSEGGYADHAAAEKFSCTTDQKAATSANVKFSTSIFKDNVAEIDCTDSDGNGKQGRYLFIKNGYMKSNNRYLTLCEVEVYSASDYSAVTKYTVQTSVDGKTFLPITKNGQVQVFNGPTNKKSEGVLNEFDIPVSGKFLRILPTQCNGACKSNFELVGGPVEYCQVIQYVKLDGGRITAQDPDIFSSDYGQSSLTYKITAGDSNGIFCFKNPEVADLYVCDPTALDYEQMPQVRLTVSVMDGGEPTALLDSATVVVTLVDLNEAPKFNGALRTVDENSPMGTNVGFLLVDAGTDPDAGFTLTYDFVEREMTRVSLPLTGSLDRSTLIAREHGCLAQTSLWITRRRKCII